MLGDDGNITSKISFEPLVNRIQIAMTTDAYSLDLGMIRLVPV